MQLGALWAGASEGTRAEYEERARRDRERYVRVSENFIFKYLLSFLITMDPMCQILNKIRNNYTFSILMNLNSTLTHLCRTVRSTFAVRETASLGIMGAPRVPPLKPSESIVLSKHYRL